MTQYTTQMDAARQGIITPQMEIVAEKEHFDVEELRELIAKGQVIIPCNKNHKCISPSGVGAKLTTKINVNLGVSRDWKDVDMEYEKVHSAVEMGAEAIMDLSSYGDTRSFRRKLTSECPAMIGTVPVYDSVIHYQRDLATLTAQDFIDVVRLHAEDGVDFVTLHCGITRKTIEQIKKDTRHFAKRQLTWFGREKEVCMVDKSQFGSEDEILTYMLTILKEKGIYDGSVKELL